MSVGEQFRQSPAVHQAIQSIVGELKSKQAAISSVRGPSSPEAKLHFEQFLKDFGTMRGRELLYAYMGSGLGNGPYVEMIDGSVKMDMITGIGVHFFGHSDPGMVGAARIVYRGVQRDEP